MNNLDKRLAIDELKRIIKNYGESEMLGRELSSFIYKYCDKRIEEAEEIKENMKEKYAVLLKEVVELREENYELNIRYLEEKNLAYKLADKVQSFEPRSVLLEKLRKN